MVHDAEFACRVRNVSLGGVFVAGPSLTIGTRVVLVFGGTVLREIETSCVARWNTADGTGLQFDGLRAVETYAVQRFIRGLERATKPLRTPLVQRGGSTT